MKKWIKDKFVVSDRGARDLVKAMGTSALKDLSMMLPLGLIYLVLKSMLGSLEKGRPLETQVLYFVPGILLCMFLIYTIEYMNYNATFLASYSESANQRIHMAEKLRRLPLSFFGMKNLTDLTTRIMGDMATIETAFSHYIPNLIGSIIALIPVTVALLVMDYRMAIALLWCVPVSFLIVGWTKRWQNHFSRRIKRDKLDYIEGIQECIDNIQDLRSMNQGESYVNGLDQKLDKYEKASIRGEIVTGIFVVSSQLVLKMGLVSTLLMGVYLLTKSEITLLTFLIFLVAAARIYDPLLTTLQHLAAIFNTELTLDRTKELYNYPVQNGDEVKGIHDFNLRFEDVSFAYHSDSKVLDGINFTAKQGQVTALIGPSGGGKSTVAKLAARFWDAKDGQIYLGENSIKSMGPESYLAYFSVVFQDVVLFNDTIMENIRLGRSKATDEEVLEAARLARCDQFVEKMDKGYLTKIGENGKFLSGGERQRISIARAILKDAPIILLDEATASLDVENETYIQEAIGQLVANKTVIIIAHRMRTIAKADHIIVLKNGKIIEQGKPENLLKNRGYYYTMSQRQEESLSWTI